VPSPTPVAHIPIAGSTEATGARESVQEIAKPQWEPGMGRMIGSRNLLSRKVMRVLMDDFTLYGAGAVERVREEDPGTYLRVIASLIPKDLRIEHEGLKTVVLDFRGTVASRDEPMIIDQPEGFDADGEE